MSIITSIEAEHTALPRGWRWTKLGEVCKINPRRPAKLQLPLDTPTTFVPMAAVDARTGTINEPELRPFSAVSRGYTYFEESDVLFAKITPCMQNGKHVVAKDLVDGFGFGTTEFHVIRHGNDVTPQWVHNYVRQSYILDEATKHFRGAVGQQRLPKEFIINLPIPIPPLSEQKRIVRALDEKLATIEKAKRAAEVQLEAANALPEAYLREIIPSDRDTLPQGWRWVKLGDVCAVVRGVTFKTSDTLNVAHPNYVACLTTSGVQDTPNWKSRRYVAIDSVKRTEQFLSTGDILVSAANSKALVGKSCIMTDLPERCTFGAFVTVVRPQGYVSAKYVAYSMRTPESKAYFYNNSSNTTNISNLKTTDLRALLIPLPSLSEQERITCILDEKLRTIDKAKDAAEAQLEMINAVPAAYSRKAFAGELS